MSVSFLIFSKIFAWDCARILSVRFSYFIISSLLVSFRVLVTLGIKPYIWVVFIIQSCFYL